MKPCFFFDRDGIVNESPGPGKYVESWDDFHLQPGFVRVLRRVTGLGFASVIITNQRCVALGRLSVRNLEAMHDRFRSVLRESHGLAVNDVFYCPHDNGQCECRKPKPGMILAAARRHGLDLAASWMVGDSASDVAAGQAAGCRTVLVGPRPGGCSPTLAVESLEALDSLIAEGRLVV